ncbi:MAG: hypothetical protein KDC45_09755 [Bacteroidetes bacterium]|nr:hypothetical protein [Bacteroidota bacterium]
MKYLVWIFVTAQLVGQNERGYPISHHFRPSEYRSAPDNWCVRQDDRGLIYVANGSGVLQFDGARWRLIPLANNSVARWLVKGLDGTMYVSGQGEFGFLQPDSVGQLRYVSLLNRTLFPQYDLDDIWEAAVSSEGIYFRTIKYLFRYKNGQIKVWEAEPPATGFDVLFTVADTVYSRLRDKYLFKVVGDSLVPLAQGDKLAGTKINSFVSYKNMVLIATRREGLFLYDYTSIRPFRTEADEFLRKNFIYHVERLSDENYAIATIHGGLIILSPEGRIVTKLTAEDVILENRVNHVMEDREHALWLSFNHGLSRVERQSPFVLFNDRMGLRGSVRSIARFNESVYVLTHLGLFRLVQRPTAPFAYFEVVHNTDSEYFDVASLDDELIFTSSERMYVMSRNGSLRPVEVQSVRFITRSGTRPGIVFLGKFDGLAVLMRDARSNWQVAALSTNIPEDVYSVIEDKQGDLWMGTYSEGVVRIRSADMPEFSLDAKPALIQFRVQRFGSKEGLSPGFVEVFSDEGGPIFSTSQGIRRWSESALRFEVVENVKTRGDQLFDQQNRLVIFQESDIPHLFKDHTRLLRLSGLNHESMYTYFSDDLGRQWIGGHELLIRYTPDDALQTSLALKTVISTVRSKGMQTVYSDLSTHARQASSLDVDENGVEVEYAIPSFDESSFNRFQYFLDGLDKTWSAWSTETKKEYAHLPPGEYVFRVRGKNVYDQMADEASIAIHVAGPWFASRWAFVVYAILLGLGIYGLIRLRFVLLNNQTRRLEEEVEKRAQLLKQAQVQLIQTEKMAALGQMVAGISHEINNPLTFVHVNLQFMKERITSLMDYIRFLREKFMSGDWDEETKAQFEVLDRSAEFGTAEEDIHGMVHTASQGSSRIMRIVEELRKFSNLDAFGQTEADLNKNMDIVIDLFLNRYRFITIERNYEKLPWADCNIGEINQCFMHVLQNAAQAIEQAIKQEILEPEAGRITIWTSFDEQLQFIRIRIRDNGGGVPEEIKARIFDPFFTTRSQGQGKGLGLSEVFSIISKHKGTIDFHSTHQRGTEFTLTLPVKR